MELLGHRQMLAEHTRDIAQNTKGVSNFNDFQKDVRSKISFMSGVAWVVTILAPLALGLAIWLMTKFVIPAASLILEDYYRHHPQAQINAPKIIAQPPALEYHVSIGDSPQDAKVPNLE